MSRQLGALSGIAMVIIVLEHAFDMGAGMPADLGYLQAPAWVGHFLKVGHLLGGYAVPVFLFVSGSFVAYAARARSDRRLSWQFLLNSLRRILFPYLIWSVIFYLLIYVQNEEQYTLFGYLKNLLVGYPFHFIPLLIFFYLLSPWLVLGLMRRPFALLLVAAGFQVLLLNVQDPAVLGVYLPSWTRSLIPPILGNTFAIWGIFFPLGVAFSLHGTAIRPVLFRFRYLLVTATLVLFFSAIAHIFSIVRLPLVRFLAPTAFMFLIPLLSRNAIPKVRVFESIGRHAYGIYLSHLIFQDLTILGVAALAPGLFDLRAFLFLLLFIAGLTAPLLLMQWLETSRSRVVYRYVFG